MTVSRRILRYAWLSLAVLVLSFAGLAVAEDPILDDTEPPVRLKKKARPEGDKPADKKPAVKPDKEKPPVDLDKVPEPPPKDKKGGKDGEAKKPAPRRNQAEEERKKLVQRILKNMRAAEDRLAKKDPCRGTCDIQRDIVKDLDKLIEQTQNQSSQQQQKQGQSGRQSRRQRRQLSKKQNSSRNSQANNQGNSGRQKPKDGGKTDKNSLAKKDDKKKGQGKKPGKNGQKDGGGMGGKGQAGQKKLAEQFKDIWGHLPEALRQEMEAYSRARFLPQYDALSKQYFRTLSEQGNRKKGD